MTAKEYLKQVRYIDQQIDCKLAMMSRLREQTTKATALITDMPRGDSPDLQQIETTVVKIADLEEEINRDIDRLVDLRRDARRAISRISDTEQRLILELRYFGYQTWEQIAASMNYSVRHITRLHGYALRKLVVPEGGIQT